MSIQDHHQELEHRIGSPTGMFHRPPSAPPPYTYPPSPTDGPGAQTESHQPTAPLHFTTVVHGSSKSSRRPLPPLPPLPEPGVDTNRLAAVAPLASGSRSSLRVSTSALSLTASSSSSSFKPPAPSPSLLTLPLATSPSSPMHSGPSTTHSAKRHSFKPFFSFLHPSKSRSATKRIAAREPQSAAQDARPQHEAARRVAELERERVRRAIAAEHARQAANQSNAREAIRSNIRSLLSRHLTSDEYEPIFKKCDQICESGDLELSSVLQEPLIDGKPPLYWAILNGPSSQGSDADFDALVVALLRACWPLNDATIISVRLACMLTSNNVLLQSLFRRFPALSPLSPGDAILLSSVGGGDVVDVDEAQDGTGTFVARIQVRRFRLRMRVSKVIKIEFVTSGRSTPTFSFE